MIYKVTGTRDGEEFYKDFFKSLNKANEVADFVAKIPKATVEQHVICRDDPEYEEAKSRIAEKETKKKSNRRK